MSNSAELTRLWTQPNLTNGQIAAELGIAKGTLNLWARAAGLPKRRTGRKPGRPKEPCYEWTAEREARLKILWPNAEVTVQQIGEDLGTTRDAAQARARKLRLPPHPQASKLKPVDPDRLTQLWCDTSLTQAQIAREVGVSSSTLRLRAKEIKLIPGAERSIRSPSR